MPELYENYQVDADTRVSAYYDEDYEGIVETLGWANQIGIQTTRHYHQYSPIGTKDEFGDALERFDRAYQWRYDGSTKTAEAFTRYLSVRGVPFITATLRGYSPSDWHDVVIYALDASITLENLQDELENTIDPLYKGDVFRLVVEKRVVYTADNGNTIERWEQDYDWDDENVTGYDNVTKTVNYLTARINNAKVN